MNVNEKPVMSMCLSSKEYFKQLAEYYRVENERLKADNEKLKLGIGSVSELISHSFGVAGLHLNGDLAPWKSLTDGGHLEKWLIDFSTAEKLI